MDLTTLDVTDIHLPVSVGGVVEFLGDRLSDQAQEAGTINYELLTRISQRVRRDYWKPREDKPSKPAPSQKTKPKSVKRQRSPGR